MNNELTLQDLLERDKDVLDKLHKERESEKVEAEFLLIAEFGLYFGWEAAQDVMHDRISFEKMHKLLKAARIMKAVDRYNNLIDVHAAIVAPHDKAKTLKEVAKGIKKQCQL